MIRQFSILRNIGTFDSVTGTNDTMFARLTLIFAENGQGKTTLSAVLRSLASGSPIPIAERKRLGAQHDPHVVIDIGDNSAPAVFENGTWTCTHTSLTVFDDAFVDANICSGLTVTAEQRQNLHQIIIGRQGVVLASEFQRLAEEIARLQATVREKASAIPEEARARFSVDDFCALTQIEHIDESIEQAERRVTAIRQAGAIASTPVFEPFEPPALPLDNLREILRSDLPSLDAQAASTVQNHFRRIGTNSERWVADGHRFLEDAASVGEQSCPFCDQPLAASRLVEHYRVYFSEAYLQHKQAIDELITNVESTLGGDALVRFQQLLTAMTERHRFWTQFLRIPPFELEAQRVSTVWQEARNEILRMLHAKQTAPLERIPFDSAAANAVRDYESALAECRALSRSLLASEPSMSTVKSDAESGDLVAATSDVARLKAVKARFSDELRSLCYEYLASKVAKASAELRKTEVREELDRHREAVFPRYQSAINEYLRKFHVGFRIVRVEAVNPRGTPSSTYQIEINHCLVPLGTSNATAVGPAFKNTLSSGDRNTLALAFFFASLDEEPDLSTTVVVVDDPVSSLDDGRTLTTAQEVRAISQRAAQVILLSHSKQVLCMVWQHADQANCATLQVGRCPTGATVEAWNIHEAAITEFDRRHALLRDYSQRNSSDTRGVAQSLRLVLEGYLRVVCSEFFPPGTLLGQFIARARRAVESGQAILETVDLDELDAIKEYANRFHHDTNPVWDTDINNINETQLEGFVGRVLAFTAP